MVSPRSRSGRRRRRTSRAGSARLAAEWELRPSLPATRASAQPAADGIDSSSKGGPFRLRRRPLPSSL